MQNMRNFNNAYKIHTQQYFIMSTNSAPGDQKSH